MLWDDQAHITRPELRSWHGLWRIWFDLGATQQYYPVAHSAFWVQHRLWGDHLLGYHLVNISLHIAAAALVAIILRGLRVPGAYLAAAVFALHPVHVESVAWITELKNTLSAVFYLAAALAYWRFDETRARGWYGLALGLFVLALGSKTVTATLPAALLLIVWWKRGRMSWPRDVVPLLPLFTIGISGGVFTTWVERRFIRAEGSAFEFSFVDRALVAGRALWFYASKILWPTDLMFVYPRWAISSAEWWQYLYPVAALALLAWLWTRRERWRGATAAVLFFAGTLFPALGFFNVYPFVFSFVADHFQYLASLGLLTLAAAGIATVLQRQRLWGRASGHAICCALLGVLAVLTWRQSRDYRDVETLYRATIAKNPDCWMALNNLGGMLIARGALDEGQALVVKAVALRPRYAEGHNNLGLVAFNRGRLDEAIGEFRRALDVRPDYADAHSNLGFALARTGKIDEGIEHYRRALETDPNAVAVHFNYGMALMAKGELDRAAEHLRKVLEEKPDHAEAHNALGSILADRGRADEAMQHVQRAVELQPRDVEAQTNLGILLARRGDLDAAVAHLRTAFDLAPDNPRVRDALGAVLATRRRKLDSESAARP